MALAKQTALTWPSEVSRLLCVHWASRPVCGHSTLGRVLNVTGWSWRARPAWPGVDRDPMVTGTAADSQLCIELLARGR